MTITTASRKTLITSAVLTAFVALAACGSDEERPSSTSEQTTSASPQQSGENVPGAMVGNTQRTWPDPAKRFDDSSHATPGVWSVDYLHSRPVWTPVNHDGDLPGEKDLSEGGFDKCQSNAESIVLSGKTTQQYVNGRYLAVNDKAGPSRLVNGVPAGFAHSPQGAIMLAINALGYGLGGQGDGVGEEIDKAWWSGYESLQKDREFEGLNKPDFDHSKRRARMVPPAGFYNVKQCSENVVVVSLGTDFKKGGATGATIPLYWRNNDWVPDLSGSAGKTFDQDEKFDPKNPAPLKKVEF